MMPVLPVAAIFALVYLPLASRPPGLIRSVVKTLSVALLAVAALAGQAPTLLALSLAFCATGDLALSRPGDRAFMAGIGCFAAGHLAYIALFLSRDGADPARLLHVPQIAAAAGLVVLGVAAAAILAPRAGGLKVPVLVYIPVILGMGLAALALPTDAAGAWAIAAAGAFVASDLVLAAETFVLPREHPAARVTPWLIWPLYWGAQAGFFMAFS